MKEAGQSGLNTHRDIFPLTTVQALSRAYSLIEREISVHLRPFGLTPAKFNAMMVIRDLGMQSGISQIEIGNRLSVTASNMTRLLDKLEKEGYIERLPQEGDRRVNLIRISRKGEDILKRASPGYYEKMSSLGNLLDTGELKHISSLLGKWCRRLG
jgi:DNA-binding MarR family transcriptional regulator